MIFPRVPFPALNRTWIAKRIAPISKQAYRPLSTAMEYTRLGDSGLKISKVILGAMSYGAPEWQEWILDEEKSLPLLEHAYNVGLNTWDTVL